MNRWQLPALASGERQIDQVVASGLGRNGTLYLTDRRLIFEWSEGIVTKRYHQVAVSLADIQTVNAAHPRLGGGELVVTTRDATNGFGTNRVTIRIAMSPETWMGKINSMLATKPSQPVQPTIILEREVVKTPCRYCGVLVDAFRNEKCPNCGAALQVLLTWCDMVLPVNWTDMT
jgi:RNA polymerase subunit RPABC4/transcription elongation factor Spt4